MVWLLRAVGIWLLRRVGVPIAEDLRAGNYPSARRRARRAATVAALTGFGFLLAWVIVAVAVMVLIIRLVT